jgi:hypothetical protein
MDVGHRIAGYLCVVGFVALTVLFPVGATAAYSPVNTPGSV